LLESILSNRFSIGSDSNPLARIISQVKTHNFNPKELRSEKKRLVEGINSSRKFSIGVDFNNIDFWFEKSTIRFLKNILRNIYTADDEKVKSFFLICFSTLARRVSLADQNISVPVKKYQAHKYDKRDIVAIFEKIIDKNILRFEKYSELTGNLSSRCKLLDIYSDCRRPQLKGKEIDLIITSPPYCGAQKYIRSCSLSLGWLGYITENVTLGTLDKESIGRENYSKGEYSNLAKTGIGEADHFLKKIYEKYPLRAHIAANYLLEMTNALKASSDLLKKEGYFILIAANNQVCGREFFTSNFLVEILTQNGFQKELELVDDIQSYGLMTKRNKTASIISCENITILRKQ
jgi:hypothetical protein